MGLYDRDYMRAKPGEEPPAPPLILPAEQVALWTLIGINCFVFVLLNVLYGSGDQGADWVEAHWLVSWKNLVDRGHWHTLLTCAFAHISFLHLLFNMFVLHVFGQIAGARLGARRLVVLYVIGALAASVAQVGLGLLSGHDVPMLGASGAVLAVGAVAAFVRPNQVLLIWGIVPVRMKWLVPFYAATDVLGAFLQWFDQQSGIAHAGHLGGLAAGVLFYLLVVRRRTGFLRCQPALHLVLPASPPPGPAAAERQKVDEILAKISREGIGSLSPAEKEFLERASRNYRP